MFAIDFAQILQFMLFTATVAAPNFVFQTVLEKCFPTRTLPKSGVKQAHAKDKNNDEDLLRKYGRLNISNTIIKFCLDQSLGATANTVLFIVLLGLIRGQGLDYICAALSTVSSRSPDPHDSGLIVRQEFWPMLLAGYRFWPVVCLPNLVLVPMEYRTLVGNGAGPVWGVMMSLW
jgi:protein Mpv17